MYQLSTYLAWGVSWAGPGAQEISKRREAAILNGLARALRSDRPSAGVNKKIEEITQIQHGLAAASYKSSSVRAALAILCESGIIRREERFERNSRRNTTSTTYFHPALIERAIMWDAELKIRKKNKIPGMPERVKIQLPMEW